MNLILFNVRSVRRNFSDFLVELVGRGIHADVIVLTEVWIYSHEVTAYNIDGFTTYSTCQENNAAGGVMIFVKNELSSVKLFSYTGNAEICAVQFKAAETKICIVGGYRSPTPNVSNTKRFIDDDIDEIFRRLGSLTEVYWMADANIDITDPKGEAEDYMNKLASHGLEWLRTSPTRDSGRGSSTTIDHIFVRESHASDLNIQLLELSKVADHKLLALSLCYHKSISEIKEETQRRVTDWRAFSKELQRIDSQQYLHEEDPAKCLETLLNDMTNIREATTKTVRIERYNTPLKPWITKSILKSMKVKDELWKSCKKFPRNEIMKDRFRKYRNIYIRILRAAENKYLQNKIDMAGDPKKAWRVINEQLRGKRCIRKLPSSLSSNQTSMESLNEANEFYATLGPRTVNLKDHYDYAHNLPNYVVKTKLTEFPKPTSLDVTDVIKRLKSGKAPGADGFTAKTLKNNQDFFVPVVQHLLHRIFESAKFPDALKRATTILVYKKGDPELLGNYRPISLLSVFSKIVEKVMANHITNHLEENGIYSDNQHGFRRGRGTQDAVLQVQKFVAEAVDAEMIPVVVLLDFSAAFDCVNHRRLLEKLKCIGIQDLAHDLLRSYLDNRTQQLRCGVDAYSEQAAVRCGVPQGGSLSALLFAIYINDLLLKSDETVTYVGYADDIALMFKFKREIEWQTIELHTQRVFDWASENGLLLNSTKSNYLVFGHANPSPRPQIRVHRSDCKDKHSCDCNGITNVTETKYLGTVLDEKLSWKPHISHLIERLRATTVTIIKARRSLSLKTTIAIYKALFESQLRYSIVAYMSTFQNSIDAVAKIQNALIRRMARAQNDYPLANLYEKLTIHSLKLLYIESLLNECLIRNPIATEELESENMPSHSYETRNATSIRLPPTRLCRTQKLPMHRYLRLAVLYSEDMMKIREQASIKKKKKAIKEFITSNSRVLNEDYPL